MIYYLNILLKYITDADGDNKLNWEKVTIDDVGFEKLVSCDYENMSIRKHSETRYDITTKSKLHNLMYKISREKFGDLIDDYLKNTGQLVYNTGILPVTGKEEGGVWHRDSYDLFKTKHIADLPPFYLNILIYLNGDYDAGTSICPGSHLDSRSVKNISELSENILIKPETGKLLLIDGRLVHKGISGGEVNMSRKVIYMTIYPFWYNEPTFLQETHSLI
jgi:hypothetical protein